MIPREDGRFTLGALAFAPCELDPTSDTATINAFCAPFEVPENWDKPDGRRIGLRLALVRSDALVAERDVVVLLAGGPGQAATEAYPRVAASFAPLLRHRNLLLLDQRGTGGSHPLTCGDDDSNESESGRAAEIDIGKVRESTRRCLDHVAKNADPAEYTTTAAVRDLEAVRQALGGPELDLVGVSYGTRVAQQYARQYPEGVRSIVLDSGVPNPVALGSEFAQNLDQALKAQFAECSRTPACEKAFGDPYASLYRLRDALRSNPVSVDMRKPRAFVPEKRTLNASSLATLARMYAYSAETSALLPLGIDRALKGDYAPLLAQTDMVTEELSSLIRSGMQLSVMCAEDADLLTDRPEDANLILGDAFARVMRAECEVWPRGRRPSEFHEPFRSDKPVLILHGELDPVTPPRYGEAMLAGLSNGRLLVAKGQGHGVMGRGCLPRLASRFVETLDVKRLDTTCVEEFGPVPAFVDYSGALP